jgi:hypothetical protein
MANPPPRPERPSFPATDEKPRRGSWLIVLVAFLMAIGGLVSLMVMPLVSFMPVIVLAIFGFVALHYFVWGWWLSNIVREEEEDDPP